MADQGLWGRMADARSFAQAGGWAVCAAAAVELVGRALGAEGVFLVGAPAVTPACLLLLSLAVVFSNVDRQWRPAGFALGVVTAGLAATGTISSLLGGAVAPGGAPFALAVGTELILLGLAAALLDFETSSRRRPADMLILAALVLAVHSALREAGLPAAGGGGPLAAVPFVILAAALAASRPRRGVFALLARDTAGAWVARRLLAVALLIPPLVGALAGAGLAGGAPAAVAFAMLAGAGLSVWCLVAIDRRAVTARAELLLPEPRPVAPAAAPHADAPSLLAEVAVNRVLASAEGLREALPGLLAAIAENLGWQLAAAWVLDRETSLLRCAETWRAPAVGAGAFEAATRERDLARGICLAGRVWASGAPVWISDAAADPEFLRAGAAAREGFHAALAFPIRAGEDFLGVIELFGRETRGRDDESLRAVETLGAWIGRFVERKRAEEQLREEVATLETVRRLASSLSSGLDVEKLVQSLTDAATKLVGARFGTFHHLRNGHDGAPDAYTSTVVSRDAFGLARPAKLLMPSFSSDGPLRVQDLRREARNGEVIPDFGGNGSSRPIASYLAVPVVSQTGLMLGGLAFAHPEPSVFSEREERVAVGLAAQMAVAIDNARLYEAERVARREAEAANRAKEEFLAMLGHELRNPIGAIRNSVQALEASQETTEAGRLLCTIVGRQTETLAHLVDDLLDVSRLMSGKIRLRRRVVDLKEVAEQTLQSLRAAGKVARHFVQLGAESVFVDGDPVRLEQIVTNLVENALKYTQAGGEIEVAVERAGEQAQLRVRDNGQGIDPDLLPRIFEVFTQSEQSLDRAKGGMGLGLALVRRLAELHGGSVEVESPGPGLGAEFRVRLPARPEAERPVLEPEAGLLPHVRRHVLIIEDHGDSRESLRLLLEVSGHRVEVAPNGFDGLELALTHRPEVAIIDIGIPGIDGYQVAREIRSADNGHHIYLVALTGYGQPIDRRRALESGFNEHMVKPVERDRLIRMLASIEPLVQEAV